MELHIVSEAGRCLNCKKPMCQQGCPIHTPIPQVIQLFKQGKLTEAGQILFENNPLSAICALIRVYGGFDALLYGIKKVFKGKKGGQLGMGLLVGAMDIATANNTVAIVMANPIAKEMATDYGISPRKTASLLDTFSCVFQGIIPYGAQMLVALSAAHELGYELSAFQIIPNLFYPFLLLISSLLFIFVIPERKIDRM